MSFSTMSKRERVEATMNLEKTDRTPVFDLLYNDYCIRYFTMSQLGTPEQVTRVSIEAIECALKGYFIGTTTEIDNSAKLENVLAMLRVAKLLNRESNGYNGYR